MRTLLGLTLLLALWSPMFYFGWQIIKRGALQ